MEYSKEKFKSRIKLLKCAADDAIEIITDCVSDEHGDFQMFELLLVISYMVHMLASFGEHSGNSKEDIYKYFKQTLEHTSVVYKKEEK